LEAQARRGADLVIRAAELSDLDAIHALECESFDTDRLSRRALRRFIRDPQRPLIVARSGATLLGYALIVARRGGKTARVYSLAVDSRHGRRGVGRELLHACERYARAQGLVALRLEVRYDNDSAIALYQKLGYQEFGRYPSYYGDGAEALRFEKPLQAGAEMRQK
jgi:ribosomal-protein-alanine N-acetyltransferase